MKARRDKRTLFPVRWLFLLLLSCLVVQAQEQLPDAPQPQKNAGQTPIGQNLPATPSPHTPPPAVSTPPASAPPAAQTNVPNPSSAPPGPPPSTPITAIPPGQAPPAVPQSPRDQLFTLTKNVNFVLLPVTVKDTNGHLVEGLLDKDFSVYENGVKQHITFFTSDPFPLSAAVVLDTALPSSQWNKVRETLPALVGAFSQFDEVSIVTYSDIVRKVQDFTGVDAERLTLSLRQVRASTGNVGVPVVSGPMTGSPTPSVNGRPFDPSVPPVQTMPKESFVLNDAIFRAADELSLRDATRRRILFVVSDGREFGSSSSYAEVLRVLLSRQITVYAIEVDNGIPGYRQAQKLRIPGLGYGDILPKYASATGGQVYAEVSSHAVEDAYSRVTDEARNQYTLGYTTSLTPSGAYRSIEVRVDQPDLRVYTRDGYYPAPPAP